MPSRPSPRSRPAKPAEAADAALVARCAESDAAAWRALVDRYRRLVYTIPYRMGLDPADADDVFQLTFTRLAERIDRLERPERVRAWLVTTARRLALNLVSRSRLMESEDALVNVADPADLPPDEIDRLERQQLVRLALSRLGRRCRRLLERLYYGEAATGQRVSYEEIAAEMDMPVGSIGPTRMRCLKKLSTEFERLAGGEDE